MRKKWIIFFTFLMGIVMMILVAAVLEIFSPDKTIIEWNIDEGCTAQIRTEKGGEGMVPVYLTITRKEGEPLVSRWFSFYRAEQIESKSLGLEIHKVDTVIFLHYEDTPHWILAIADLKDNVIYPYRAGYDYEKNKLYYAKVQKLFDRLKALLNNDELELKR